MNVIVVQAVSAIIGNPILSRRSPGKEIVSIANKVNEVLLENVEFQQHMSSFFVEILYPLLQEKLESLQKRELVNSRFYNLSISASIQAKWESVLQSLSVHGFSKHIENNLFQRMLDKVWLYSIQWRTSLFAKEVNELSQDELKLTTSEEQTLRYVAGYIPYSMKKKYSKFKVKSVSDAVVDFFNSWSTQMTDDSAEVMTFLAYTNTWIEKCNRGGLFVVKDDVYIFIRRVENVARTVFNKNLLLTYCNEDIRNVLLEDFSKNSLIDKSWESLTRKLSNKDLSTKLKVEVLNKWINIRSKSFLTAWLACQKLRLEETKKKNSLASKAEPSLRKSLPVKPSSSGISEKAAPSMRHSLKRKSC